MQAFEGTHGMPQPTRVTIYLNLICLFIYLF